jgi:hypothetical protein
VDIEFGARPGGAAPLGVQRSCRIAGVAQRSAAQLLRRISRLIVEAGRKSTRAMARVLLPISFMLEITMRSSDRSCL